MRDWIGGASVLLFAALTVWALGHPPRWTIRKRRRDDQA